MQDEKRYPSTLKGILDAANKYIKGEWDEKTMAEYGQTMTIRAYVPILEKTGNIVTIINKHIMDVGMAEFAVADIHKDMFFYGLLQMYGMVDCSDESLVTYENYDLLYPLFYPFITSYCKDDYEEYKELFKDSISMSNIRSLLTALEEIDGQAIEKTIAANANMLNTFKSNEELINKLNDIMVMNDPNTKAVVDELKKMAVEDINK